jgi:serine/threonine-protein kinase
MINGNGAGAGAAKAPMTPERWRAVDAILQAVLACEPAQRAAFVADACGSDAAMRAEVESLLAAAPTGDFLERPAAAQFGAIAPVQPVAARLATAVEGRYTVERELARGGMATVHLALDPRHQRHVAIKVLREELTAALGAERFLKEIAVTASLQHPHILPLFDSGSAGGLLYYVMPYVEGETLRSRLAREGPLPVNEAVRLAREIADALDHAHARGVVHRDVKPENVLLQGGHALVADFGIALAIQEAGGERITRTGLALGTPQYMAPEQASGEREIDARADVYALGAVLYEMLAGEPPFAAPTAQAVYSRVLTEVPTPVIARRRDVPPWVNAAVNRALEKKPIDRYPSAGAFAAALVAPALHEAGNGVHGRRGRYLSVATTAKLVVAALGIGVFAGWSLARSQVVANGIETAQGPIIQRPSPLDVRTWLPDGQGLSLAVMDRAGRVQQTIPASRPWTPRFSPDGRRVAYGAFGEGRSSSDVFVTTLDGKATQRLTDDDNDSNDPQWSPDGRTVGYSASAPEGKDVVVQRTDEGTARPLARRAGNQFPSDWLPDGSGLLLTDDSMNGNQDIWIQPTDGSPARSFLGTDANESAARVSPDGRWVAFTSNESGRDEVYVQSYPKPGYRMRISVAGGRHPVWKGDGRELYYWNDDQLTAVRLEPTDGKGAAIAVRGRTPLFRAKYHGGINAMYDVSPDGTRFVMVVER